MEIPDNFVWLLSYFRADPPNPHQRAHAEAAAAMANARGQTQQYVHECYRCGHVWADVFEVPERCENCYSRHWTIPTLDGEEGTPAYTMELISNLVDRLRDEVFMANMICAQRYKEMERQQRRIEWLLPPASRAIAQAARRQTKRRLGGITVASD